MQVQGKNEGVITYVNSGSAILSGALIDLGSRIGVALVDIDATTGTGSVAVEGIFMLAKDTSTFTLNQEVFWKASTSQVVGTQVAGYPRVGIITAAAATGDGYCHVEINAPRTVGTTSIASGAGDAAANAAAIITIIGILQAAGLAKKP